MKLVSLYYLEPIDDVMAEKIHGGLTLPTEPFGHDDFHIPDLPQLLGYPNPTSDEPLPDCAAVSCLVGQPCPCQ